MSDLRKDGFQSHASPLSFTLKEVTSRTATSGLLFSIMN
jgi:hypothetical protein